MTDRGIGASRGGAPRHLWVVGVLALLWGGYAAYDYLMTQLQGEAYMRSSGLTDAQIAYFAGEPIWLTANWAVGVWGAVLGALLLLLRRRWALPVFVISFAAFLVGVVYMYVLTDGGDVMGTPGVAFNTVIGVVCILLILYSRAMAKRGVLR